MMIDPNCLFSGSVASSGARAGQAVTATTLSTNVMDTRINGAPAVQDLGMWGEDLWLVVVTQAFNNLTSLAITLESDSAATISVAPVVHFSKTIALAGLTAGAAVVKIQLPSDDYKEFAALRYTVNGTAPTAGAITAFLTPDVQRNVGFAPGWTLDV